MTLDRLSAARNAEGGRLSRPHLIRSWARCLCCLSFFHLSNKTNFLHFWLGGHNIRSVGHGPLSPLAADDLDQKRLLQQQMVWAVSEGETSAEVMKPMNWWSELKTMGQWEGSGGHTYEQKNELEAQGEWYLKTRQQDYRWRSLCCWTDEARRWELLISQLTAQTTIKWERRTCSKWDSQGGMRNKLNYAKEFWIEHWQDIQ